MTECTHPKSRKAKRCHACQIAHINSDPSVAERRKQRMAEYWSKPENVGRARAKLAKIHAQTMADPAQVERKREHGRKQAREYLHRPDILAKTLSPDTRARAGKSRTETVMAWCPQEYRLEYFTLVRSKGVKAKVARTMVEEHMKADIMRNIRMIEVKQHARAARERDQAY